MLTDSKLGFGLMRLPKNDQGEIELLQVKAMVDAYMEKGFNYFDTAYVYQGSEDALKKALVERYPRESFTIANKLPGWKINEQSDLMKLFNESLARCGVDYFDFYLLHSIEKKHYASYEKYHCFEFLKELKKQGKIKYMGFSFHDNSQLLDDILTKHPEVDFVQLQINYLDWENEVIQSRQNYEVARKHHKPIIIMEPVKGGTLAQFKDDVEQIYRSYAPERSMASWALRYVGSLEGVMTILSGMSAMEQVEDNLNTMSHFQKLNAQEYECIAKVKAQVLAVDTIPCTKCHYCTPGCPMKINIPELFTAYNSTKLYGESRRYVTYYKDHIQDGHASASQCIGCMQCEGVCPQHLPIISLLKDVAELFDQH